MATLAPPTKLTTSHWADNSRRLSSESAAKLGRWPTIRAETTENTSHGMSKGDEQTLHSYGQDVIYNLPRHSDPEEDHKAIRDMGRRAYKIIAEADAIDTRERKAYIVNRLDELDGGLQDAAE